MKVLKPGTLTQTQVRLPLRVKLETQPRSRSKCIYSNLETQPRTLTLKAWIQEIALKLQFLHKFQNHKFILLKHCLMTYFHRPNKNIERLWNVSDFSKAIYKLKIPPKTDLHTWIDDWGSKLPRNEWAMKMKMDCPVHTLRAKRNYKYHSTISRSSIMPRNR